MARHPDWVHWTGGIRRHYQAFFWLRVFSAPKQSPRPPTCQQRQPLDDYSQPLCADRVVCSGTSSGLPFGPKPTESERINRPELVLGRFSFFFLNSNHAKIYGMFKRKLFDKELH